MKHLVLLGTILLVGNICGNAQNKTARAPAANSSQRMNVSINVAVQKNIPIAIIAPSIKNDSGRELSTFSFQVQNTSGGVLQTLSLSLLVRKPDGRVLGGEGIRLTDPVQTATDRVFEVPLRHYIAFDDILDLAITKVGTTAGSWSVPLNQLGKTPPLPDLALTPAIASFQPATGSSPNECCSDGVEFCKAALSAASSYCPKGIQSFSCNACSCQYSFTCK